MTAPSAPDFVLALAPSEPVVFDGFSGILQRAARPTGSPVLMISPFGYEELCARAFWTVLADRLATAGFESLRFDLPGTANALDTPPDGLEDWRRAAIAAAARLRAATGHSHLTVLGLGLGATLAATWAADLGPLTALVLLEPATTGRAYLRGLKAWGAAMASGSGLVLDEAAATLHSVAGFAVAEERAAALRGLDLAKAPVPDVPASLVLEQAGGQAGKRLAKLFGAAGVAIERRDFPGYAALVTDPTSAVVPEAAIEAVVTWLRPLPPSASRSAAALPLSAPAVLTGDGFIEQPIRFGPDRRLAGTLCLPAAADRRGRAVVIANAGRDFSIGWARSAVTQARALARNGVASLRFDLGGIGDSRPAPDAPDEILYSAQMCRELRLGVDQLETLGFQSLGLVGRCSGAWAAFTLAVEDERIATLVLVNTLSFLWDPSQNLAEAMRFSQRSVGNLGATLLKRNGFQRLLRGQLDLRGGARFLIRQANQRLLGPCAPFLGPLTADSRRFRRIHSLFGRLRTRSVRVLLAYSEGDASVGELRSIMGRDLARLRHYPDAACVTIPQADHNVTPEPARRALDEQLLAFLDAVPMRRPLEAVTSGRNSYRLLSMKA